MQKRQESGDALSTPTPSSTAFLKIALFEKPSQFNVRDVPPAAAPISFTQQQLQQLQQLQQQLPQLYQVSNDGGQRRSVIAKQKWTDEVPQKKYGFLPKKYGVGICLLSYL
ncbi:unnamed protein product [Gongylonema pulchrum]|uniref:Uncharacterized protein n=1 Tax=Gongylonema pulchrum TaxID=637853 RepID=A0A183EV99_9BILA|nr:unnamed protein product [Gongylonema pulchrum]